MEIRLGGFRADPKDKIYKPYHSGLFSGAAPISVGDIDLRPFSSPRHNQRTTNSCVAQSLVKALEIKRIQAHGREAHVDLSIMHLYYGARELMNPREVDKDAGTHISLACDMLRTNGVCREMTWPTTSDNLYIPPSVMAYRECYLNKIQANYRINSTGWERVDDVIDNLRMGNPVVFGTLVGSNWFNYQGKKPLEPTPWDKAKGSHAICLVGWVDGKFIIENSWGESWGMEGFAELEPEVIADSNSQDFWVIVSGSEVWAEKK